MTNINLPGSFSNIMCPYGHWLLVYNSVAEGTMKKLVVTCEVGKQHAISVIQLLSQEERNKLSFLGQHPNNWTRWLWYIFFGFPKFVSNQIYIYSFRCSITIFWISFINSIWVLRIQYCSKLIVATLFQSNRFRKCWTNGTKRESEIEFKFYRIQKLETRQLRIQWMEFQIFPWTNSDILFQFTSISTNFFFTEAFKGKKIIFERMIIAFRASLILRCCVICICRIASGSISLV